MGLFDLFKKDKTEKKDSELTKDFKSYFSSLKPVSEKFTRIDDKGGIDEETGEWVEGTMEEYLNKEAILEDFFLGDKHTPTRTKGENEEGWNEQKWDKGSSQWVDVSSDYEKTTTDPIMSGEERNEIMSWGAGRDFERKWDKWAEEALPPDQFLGADFEQVSNRMMIEQLKYSTDPNDIIIKAPEVGQQKVVSVRRQRDDQRTEKYPEGKSINAPIIYTFEDGSEWTQAEGAYKATSISTARDRIGRSIKYPSAIYDARGNKIVDGDLSTTGWIPYKSTEDMIMDSWEAGDSKSNIMGE